MSSAKLLNDLRANSPLVHCITNYVAMNIAANVVLAAGASPAMVHAQEEMQEFTPISGALTINIGTLSSPWLDAMLSAAAKANEAKVPWVLDPVAHFISGFRKKAAQDLVSLNPAIIRGNASEILALAGEAGAGKGVDSGDSVEAAHNAAMALAKVTNGLVAITGETDFITDGDRTAQTKGGSPLMPQVTAMGCSLTALMGAYVAVGEPFEAALASLSHFKIAGSRAAEHAKGPGSFQMHFLDELAATKPEDLAQALV